MLPVRTVTAGKLFSGDVRKLSMKITEVNRTEM
jgi:hypothetical protein